jgi:hypothetical protein
MIKDNANRLRCFDAAAASAKPTQLPRAPADGQAVPAATDTPAAFVAGGPSVRVAAGYGFGVGDHTGSFRVLSGDLNLQSFAGSSGDTVSAQVWLDHYIGNDWTTGLEYTAFRNEGKASLALPNGLSILTDPVSGGARVKLAADIGFLNVAYRPAGGTVHPFIGGGVGAGYGRGSVWYNFSNAFLGHYAAVSAAGKPIAGVQGFTGVEFDLTEQLYIAVMPKIIVLNAHPIGVDQRYMEFSVDGVMGWHF